MISTAYQLPFRFHYSERVFSAGQAATLVLRGVAPEAVPAVEAALAAFAALARTGALCGGSVPPWEAGFTLGPVLAADSRELRYVIEYVRLADEALVVLAHMLLAATTAVDLVEVGAPTATVLRPLGQKPELDSSYPPRFEPLPFRLVDLGPQGGSYSFRIELEQPLQDFHEGWLNAALAAWMDAILAGGYALAPLPADDNYVETVGDEVTAYANMIEWAVFKLRADPVAIDGLLNLLAAFHVRCQRILAVEIL